MDNLNQIKLIRQDLVNTSIILAEIGINYAYGSDPSRFIDNAKRLIEVADLAGVDYVKFQKRDPESCVPQEQRSAEKWVPWRPDPTTYIQYKKDIEFTVDQYRELEKFCSDRGVKWFTSVWDKKSIDEMSRFQTLLPNNKWGTMMKVPSALIHDLELLELARDSSDFLIISTGMSTQAEIDRAIEAGRPDVVMHTNSTYPAPVDELNLDYITYLNHINVSGDFEKKFEVGYSGHEFGLTTTIAAAVLGARWIERHITLDRTLWGSDQMASVEPQGLIKLVKSLRDIKLSRGGYGPREVLASELEKRKTLRGR
jgi:N-acetylneuraminate synthase